MKNADQLCGTCGHLTPYATEELKPVDQRRLVLLGPEESTARARAAFVAARKRDNGESYHPVSLAKDWTGRGFKEGHVDRHWQNFLEGWNAAMKQNAPVLATADNKTQPTKSDVYQPTD